MKVFELILKFGMIKELELRKKMGSNIEMRERQYQYIFEWLLTYYYYIV